MMTWLLFAWTAAVIVVAGVFLARYGDAIGERSGLGRSWIGVVLIAGTTSLPELFTGFGATALERAPDIAIGDVLGSCMFNLLILSFMDAVQPARISGRAHQGHALAIGLGLVLVAVAGLGLLGGAAWPALGWVGLYSPILVVLYALAVRATFLFERQRLAGERAVTTAADAPEQRLSLRGAVSRYAVAAFFVVIGALFLPSLGAVLARQTGLGDAFVGSVLIAVTTSLPEIVVSLAAVRMGALELAIGNVLGSNLFNLLVLGLDDVWYTPGPLLAAADPSHLVAVLAIVLMNAVFLTALTQQVITKRYRVSWDAVAIAVIYAGALWLMFHFRAQGLRP